MKRFFIIVLLFIACFIVEGVFIFKSGNSKEAKLSTFNENDTEGQSVVNNVENNNREFKWEVTEE